MGLSARFGPQTAPTPRGGAFGLRTHIGSFNRQKPPRILSLPVLRAFVNGGGGGGATPNRRSGPVFAVQ